MNGEAAAMSIRTRFFLSLAMMCGFVMLFELYEAWRYLRLSASVERSSTDLGRLEEETGSLRRRIAGRLVDALPERLRRREFLPDAAGRLFLSVWLSRMEGLLSRLELEALSCVAEGRPPGEKASLDELVGMSRLFLVEDEAALEKLPLVSKISHEYSLSPRPAQILSAVRSLGRLAPLLGGSSGLVEAYSKLASSLSGMNSTAVNVGKVRAELRREEERIGSGLAVTAGLKSDIGIETLKLFRDAREVFLASSAAGARKALGALESRIARVERLVTSSGLREELGPHFDAYQRSLLKFVRRCVEYEAARRRVFEARRRFVSECTMLERLCSKAARILVEFLSRRLGSVERLSSLLKERLSQALAESMTDEEVLRLLAPSFAELERKARLEYIERLGQAYRSHFWGLTCFVVLGMLLGWLLSHLFYRNLVVGVLEALKTGLNNLAIGGEARKINVRVRNELGDIVEAYNRYLDRMSSIRKGSGVCPRCGASYELGDNYCRECGWRLR